MILSSSRTKGQRKILIYPKLAFGRGKHASPTYNNKDEATVAYRNEEGALHEKKKELNDEERARKKELQKIVSPVHCIKYQSCAPVFIWLRDFFTCAQKN